jgi:hypothetical protein
MTTFITPTRPGPDPCRPMGKHVKTGLILVIFGVSLVLAEPTLLAQNTNTLTQPWQNQTTSESEWSLSEQSLLPAGLEEKLNLTDEQKTGLKPIEDDFAKTCREYQAANQPRIDAAAEADRQARIAKDEVKILAAHKQLEQVWAGLQPYRVTAVNQIKPLLTPDQLKMLEDANNSSAN